MRAISGLVKSNIVYAIGSAANSAALFLLIPYLINTLTPAEYGAWAILEVVIMLLHLLMLLGRDVGMMREYWFLGDDQERKRLAGSVLVAVVLLGGLVSVLLVTIYSLWGDLPILQTWLDDFPPGSLLLVIFISLFEAVFTIILSIFRIREEAALSNGQVRWEAYGSMNRVLCGHCSLQSGVLFIGPEDQEEGKGSREDFIRKLEKLPQWDRTKLWSHSLALRRCQAWPHKAPPAAVIEKDTWGQSGVGRDHIIYVKPDMERTQRLGGQYRSAWAARFKAAKISLSRLHLPLVFRSRKPSWHLSRRVNFRLIWLILVVMASVLLGLILSLHSVKERFHRFHSSERHHRE